MALYLLTGTHPYIRGWEFLIRLTLNRKWHVSLRRADFLIRFLWANILQDGTQ